MVSNGRRGIFQDLLQEGFVLSLFMKKEKQSFCMEEEEMMVRRILICGNGMEKTGVKLKIIVHLKVIPHLNMCLLNGSMALSGFSE